jgi:hypothetical protein
VIRALAREPLVHVLVLGALLVLVHRRLSPPPAGEEIVVTGETLNGLRQDFRRRSGRLPTPTEEQGIVERFVDDEVLVREALALGLDRGDIIVRRRLLQKMEFLLESTEPVPAPTDAELQASLDAHPERYATPERVSLTQVFVSRERHGERAAANAVALRDALVNGADPATLGDPFLHGRTLVLRTRDELAAQVGAELAGRIMALPLDTWSEPLPSPFGMHLVKISERRPAEVATLASVRDQVLSDWRAEQRHTLDRAARERLRSRYAVRVEATPP